MAAPEREFVGARNEDDGHACAYSRTRDAEMADLRPALMGGPKSPLPFGRSDLKRSTGPFAGLCP
ncbi:MAG: hypothetical protein MI753_03250, partial [Hyphomicrobiales bacterium]|nr:hypothetical protein [Hyphomicrobiales bacterium]